MEEAIRTFATNLKHTGTELAFNFPGFHSTLLFNEFDNDIISMNEAVAYASAWGASQAGKKSLVCFRELGLNIAADAYINSLFTGVGSGLVVVIFSDLEFEGSQCIMDASNYVRFGGIWLRPDNYDNFIISSKIANLISNIFDLPVIIELANNMNYKKNNTKNNIINSVERIITSYPKYHSKNEPIVHPINSYVQFCELFNKNKNLSLMASEINNYLGFDLVTVYSMKDFRMHSVPEKNNYIISTRYEKIFSEIKNNFNYICGDIGEFTKDTLNTVTHALSLGSSIAVAMGMSVAGKEKVVAIVGDGAFFHSARNAVDELIKRRLNTKIVLIDNNGLYSTGGQNVFGIMPSYIKMLELDLSIEVPQQRICETIKKFCSDPEIMLLKIRYKI